MYSCCFMKVFYNSRAVEAPKCKIAEKATPNGSRSLGFYEGDGKNPSDSETQGGDNYGIQNKDPVGRVIEKSRIVCFGFSGVRVCEVWL